MIFFILLQKKFLRFSKSFSVSTIFGLGGSFNQSFLNKKTYTDPRHRSAYPASSVGSRRHGATRRSFRVPSCVVGSREYGGVSFQ